MQNLIVENIMDHIIRFNGKFCTNKNYQLLLYICGKNDVEKKKIVQTLELKFKC